MEAKRVARMFPGGGGGIGIIFLILLLLSSCIKEVEFTPQEPPQRILVVDGRVTTNPHQILRLSEVGPFGRGRAEPVSGATITLRDSSGLEAGYVESAEEPGEYLLDDVRGQVGKTYWVEIRLADERIIRSRPETMPPVPPVDSLSWSVDLERFQLESGAVQEKNFVNVRVYTTLAPQEEGPYLRWEVQTVYTFAQPFIPDYNKPYICFITEANDPQALRLYDGSGVRSPQQIDRQVGKRLIDWVFDWRHYFNVYQSSLTGEAYRYWLDVDRVSNQVGNIFDSPPAAVRGNLSDADDPQKLVLGYFGAGAVDTARFFTTRPDLGGLPIIPYCGNLFVRPSPLPPACFDCIILPNSSYERPDYF